MVSGFEWVSEKEGWFSRGWLCVGFLVQEFERGCQKGVKTVGSFVRENRQGIRFRVFAKMAGV